jgi:hypothetical protein
MVVSELMYLDLETHKEKLQVTKIEVVGNSDNLDFFASVRNKYVQLQADFLQIM